MLSKSTAVHAKILAPESTSFYEVNDIPEYENPEEVLLLYPSDDVPTVSEFQDWDKISTVVFIDSQWHAAKKILKLPNVAKLPRIKIDQYSTQFWRYQRVGPECLATIEAIYYFMREYQLKTSNSYDGEYDNLLFYFTYFYNKIQKHYQTTNKNFKNIENYIKPETTQ
eukprot:TRINITY_DN711_c2_g1_i2.p1 TRINITY_DN711_c2_g1~~TRINITY_DN711_c2_g1_i2.p1  ORF type:complete len:168 (+),score=29.10 TRINITY_DN711_c2_g1_i2:378-881(+)